jgi:hypothetical protein
MFIIHIKWCFEDVLPLLDISDIQLLKDVTLATQDNTSAPVGTPLVHSLLSGFLFHLHAGCLHLRV